MKESFVSPETSIIPVAYEILNQMDLEHFSLMVMLIMLVITKMVPIMEKENIYDRMVPFLWRALGKMGN